MSPRIEDPRRRFFRRVAPCLWTGCWIWTGGQKGGGYGAIQVDCRSWRAHRWSYTTFIGPIPDDLELDHLCRNKLCVNPDHLEAVTRIANIQRRPVWNSRKTHCVHGHEFTLENTRIEIRDGRVRRQCRQCGSERALANYRRDPQAANRIRARRRAAQRGLAVVLDSQE